MTLHSMLPFQSYQGSILSGIPAKLGIFIETFNPIKVLFYPTAPEWIQNLSNTFNPIKVLFYLQTEHKALSRPQLSILSRFYFILHERRGDNLHISFQSYQGSILSVYTDLMTIYCSAFNPIKVLFYQYP